MRFYQLQQWLDWLETLHPKSIDLGLDRVKTVADKLNLTHFSCPVVTVAGTNGKGSAIALLEAIYRTQGYRVAVQTSPHLIDFRERLRMNTALLDEAIWCQAFEKIDQHRKDISLSYFEFTVLVMLQLIAERQANLDVILLEVGLGGRLDATNIVEPDVSVITTVDLDHQAYLGNNREQIGREKAGIFRASKPAVCGDRNPPASVVQHAQVLKAMLYCQGSDFDYANHSKSWQWKNTTMTYQALPYPKLHPANASTALQVVDLLQAQLPVGESAIHEALTHVNVPGRWQRLPANITSLVDVAHNPQATQYLSEQLESQPVKGRTFAVVGMLADKAIKASLQPLLSAVDQWYCADLRGPRGASADSLVAILGELGVNVPKTFSQPRLAYEQALQDASANDRILTFGSFLTVGQILEHYG